MAFLIIMLDSGTISQSPTLPDAYLQNAVAGYVDIVNMEDRTYYNVESECWEDIVDVPLDEDDSHNEGF